MTSHLITYTPTEAREMGYVSVTTPYSQDEKALFDKAINEMQGADYIVVLDRFARPEIYRKKTELKLEL